MAGERGTATAMTFTSRFSRGSTDQGDPTLLFPCLASLISHGLSCHLLLTSCFSPLPLQLSFPHNLPLPPLSLSRSPKDAAAMTVLGLDHLLSFPASPSFLALSSAAVARLPSFRSAPKHGPMQILFQPSCALSQISTLTSSVATPWQGSITKSVSSTLPLPQPHPCGRGASARHCDCGGSGGVGEC